VLLPPLPGVSDALARLDGLVLSGGGDVDPDCYAAARDKATDPASEARDSAEFALCTAALAAGLPMLGICRGLQVINVVLGGTLHQHLPDVVGTDLHSPVVSGYGQHEVTVAAGSRLAGVLGRTQLAVPTHHHQAADKLGAGLVATAWTADGIIEAAEFGAAGDRSPDGAAGHGSPDGAAGHGSPDGAAGDRSPFMIAVQWHPEAGDDLSLFRGLVAEAGRRIALPEGATR
jgi:putative glutamine amidotransferase